MKIPHSPRGGRMIIGLLTCLCSFGSASAADIPTGKLNVDRTLVRVGSRSQLDWQIRYPVGVTTLTMRVRVVGASFQVHRSNKGGGNNFDRVDADNPKTGSVDPTGTPDDEKKFGKAIPLPVEVMWNLNNSSWVRIFHGTSATLNPTTIVVNTTVNPTDVVSFGARGFRDGGWLPFYSTASPTPNVVVLENGAPLPPTIQQTFIDSTLKPYIAADNTVRIGTRDRIVLIELGQTNPIYADFNLQDLVLLVTYEESTVK